MIRGRQQSVTADDTLHVQGLEMMPGREVGTAAHGVCPQC